MNAEDYFRNHKSKIISRTMMKRCEAIALHRHGIWVRRDEEKFWEELGVTFTLWSWSIKKQAFVKVRESKCLEDLEEDQWAEKRLNPNICMALSVSEVKR